MTTMALCKVLAQPFFQPRSMPPPKTTADASWSKGLDAPVIKALAAEAAGAASLNEAILKLVCGRFSNLLLMPLDKVDPKKPLASYGIDSMIAAEYWSWF